jgi:hypothetical protein
VSGAIVAPIVLGVAGTISMAVAVVHERRMHRHRQPGVSYAQATYRRDGGWRRADLFTPEGLAHQHRASRYGVTGAALWVLALVAWGVTVFLHGRL